MPVASPAFVDLCQAQFQLLHQTLGTISAVVYVTEAAAATPPDFVPVFRYPHTAARPGPSFETPQGAPRPLPETLTGDASYLRPTDQPPSLSSSTATPQTTDQRQQTVSYPNSAAPDPTASNAPENAPENAPDADGLNQATSEQQLVLPLMHQETVVGAMVILHHERHWQRHEQQYLQQVADGIAAGYILERQNQWLQQQLQTKRQIQGQQSEIFHNLLHQFRNPLTALGTFGKLLVKRLPSEDPNRSIATSIVRESERLSGLVKDFDHTVEIGDSHWQSVNDLDQQSPNTQPDSKPTYELPSESALSGNPLPAQLPPVAGQHVPAGLGHELTLVRQPLKPLVEPLLILSKTLAAERQLNFAGQLPSIPLTVTVDTQAFQEVVRNLLDNALKYARPDDWVWLQVQADRTAAPTRVGIAIGDTGAGIPLADQARLFERNYRGVQAQGNIPGTGLGLAIAKDLITQMQGEIELISPLSIAHLDWVPPAVQTQHFPHPSPPSQGKALGGTLFIIWIPLTGRALSG